MSAVQTLIVAVISVATAPLLGGLLAGVDRKLTARMQSRWGPPVLQPFYDVRKLFQKENIVVRRSQNFYVYFFLFFMVFTAALFFTGGDLLLTIFALTLASIFFVLGAYKASSPYSFIGAERELILMMAYEPMVLLAAVGMYLVTRSFIVGDIARYPRLLVQYLPGLFTGFVIILVFKTRKSPFDLSMSHHAHQEIVRGVTTEFSGRTLALIEIAHWYETVVVLGMVALFFASIPWLAAVVTAAVFFTMILVDNVFARVKWQLALASGWIVAATLGVGNIMVVYFLR
ncbi:MAG: complex I subunit 1 family protein [Spirochaetia bacterium]